MESLLTWRPWPHCFVVWASNTSSMWHVTALCKPQAHILWCMDFRQNRQRERPRNSIHRGCRLPDDCRTVPIPMFCFPFIDHIEQTQWSWGSEVKTRQDLTSNVRSLVYVLVSQLQHCAEREQLAKLSIEQSSIGAEIDWTPALRPAKRYELPPFLKFSV